MPILSSPRTGTLAEVLQELIPEAPAGYLRQLVRTGKVTRNGHSLSADDILLSGDSIDLPASDRLKEFLREASAERPSILLETDHYLVLAKPSGMAVHASPGHEEQNLHAWLEGHLKKRRVPYRTAPVHRIDLETSGIILFGKGKKACSILGTLLMSGGFVKEYLAWVHGTPPDQGSFVDPVESKGALREARTDYHREESSGNFSLLRLRIHSGRKHQIRQHLASAGYPVVGDTRYGPPRPAAPRILLHATHLSFTDPWTSEMIDVSLPKAEEFKPSGTEPT